MARRDCLYHRRPRSSQRPALARADPESRRNRDCDAPQPARVEACRNRDSGGRHGGHGVENDTGRGEGMKPDAGPAVLPASRLSGRLLALVLSAACVTFAATTTTWEMSGYQDFLRGRMSGLSLTRDGKLVIGPKIETLFTS